MNTNRFYNAYGCSVLGAGSSEHDDFFRKIERIRLKNINGEKVLASVNRPLPWILKPNGFREMRNRGDTETSMD